ncbi:hypothetical protein NESM_000765000 [Novymonas esmeraldas]|uniref:Uncharacterized protein n=1 Tax=Novymonas esmeraldas TaxID=1808958 RepID=A0AAW0EYZ3_9TRYP
MGGSDGGGGAPPRAAGDPAAFDDDDAAHSPAHGGHTTNGAGGLRVDVPPMRALPARAADGDGDDDDERSATASTASDRHGGESADAVGAARAAATPAPTASTSAPSTEVRTVLEGHPASAAGAAAAPRPAPLAVHPVPETVVFRKDPDKDGVGYKAVLESITNPQTLMWTHGAFRTVAFVAFPLLTIAIHPNTMFRLGFPQMLIASVVSTSTHRTTLGEQIGVHSWTWRGIAYMLVFGTVVCAWQVQRHIGAWYGILALGVFVAGLVSNGMLRRFMYLYFFIFMMEIRMFDHYFGNLPISNAAWSAADYLIGSVLGMAALCFPTPLLVKSLVDTIMGKVFEGLGKMFSAMIAFVWMPDAHAACLFFDDRAGFVKIEAILEVLPPLLWFANWEPLEFPLHNPIRRLKLSLLRRVMALTYAAFGAGQTIAELHRHQADRVAMQGIRSAMYHAAHGSPRKALTAPSSSPSSGSPGRQRDASSSDGAPGLATAREAIAALRANSGGCVREFGAALTQATILLGSALNTPELLVTRVPFDALREKDTAMRRNLRLEVLQVMKIQSDLVARRRTERQREEEEEEEEQEQRRRDGKDSADTADSADSAVEDANAPFGGRRGCGAARADARLLLEHRDIIDDAEVFIRMNEIFFHLLLGMIAGELLSFGEEMQDYRPPMSLGRRLLHFFVVEPWNDFWEELWCRVSFARPCDYRTVKDAIRMTCAYLSATALNIELWVVPGGLYFFGVTILLGLPVEEESLNMCVNRMAGNSLGCALGFMAYHNSHNTAQMLAMTLCFTFIQQCCKNHPTYGQTFFYGSVITMAGMATSMVTNELLTRMIASCYTIIAYMLCCMFILPNNSIKICWGYRCKLAKVMSEVVDDVALALRAPVEHGGAALPGGDDGGDGGGGDGAKHEPVAYPRCNTEAMQLCSQLNVQMSLADVLMSMCDKWAPFAARQPVIRGSAPFPAGPSALIGLAHKRMVANLRLLVFGVQLLHRPRSGPVSANIARILSGSLAAFLEEFSGCVRLLSQDFIDSMQVCRKWSYPLSLSRTSQLSRLRVRLHAMHYECYVVVANYMSRGTFGMTGDDFAELRREAAQRAAQAEATLRGAVHVHAGGDGGDGAAGDGAAGDGAETALFVDRYLNARRVVDALQGSGGDDGVAAESGADSASVAEHLRHSMALPVPHSTSFCGADGTRSFVHRAPLEESRVVPVDAFPLTQDSAEMQVQQRIRAAQERDRREHAQAGAGDQRAASPAPPGDAVDASHQPPYDAVGAGRSKSAIARMALLPGDGSDAYIPLYRGPAFTFVEDELSMPSDTDFSAIMTILCSCDSLITELKGLPGCVNSINAYHRQLHESSLALDMIDRLSAKLTALRKSNHDRYHHPPPPPQRRNPLHSQSDPWKDWRF